VRANAVPAVILVANGIIPCTPGRVPTLTAEGSERRSLVAERVPGRALDAAKSA
jgi:hypothetical protein